MIRDRFVQEKLDESKELFKHYFGLALGGLSFDGQTEIESAVEALFHASVEQAKLELRAESQEDVQATIAAAELRADYKQRVRDEGL